MNMLDGLMNQFGGQIGAQVAQVVATKFGIDPAMAQTAIAALTRNHPLPNNTVDAAAQQTGMSPDMLSQIVAQLGGENALGQLTGMMGTTAPQDATTTMAGTPDVGGILGGLVGNLMGGAKR